ncbi:MAG: hypothetical protein U0264_18005 [Candidatus Kapaibacterium sp.]
MFKQLAFVLVSVMLLASCSKDSTPTGTNTVTYVQPKAGSIFVFETYNTDTTSNLPIASSRDTARHTFLQTALSFMGKTNVSKITKVSTFFMDTTYLNYESNNDVSTFVPDTASGKWITFPYSSKTPLSFTAFEGTFDIFGIMTTVKSVATITYSNETTMTVKGSSLSVLKFKQDIVTTSTAGGVSTTNTQNGFIYIAPSLGYVVKIEQLPYVSSSGDKLQGQVENLIDYTLK